MTSEAPLFPPAIALDHCREILPALPRASRNLLPIALQCSGGGPAGSPDAFRLDLILFLDPGATNLILPAGCDQVQLKIMDCDGAWQPLPHQERPISATSAFLILRRWINAFCPFISSRLQRDQGQHLALADGEREALLSPYLEIYFHHLQHPTPELILRRLTRAGIAASPTTLLHACHALGRHLLHHAILEPRRIETSPDLARIEIVIPVYGQIAYTLTSLASVLKDLYLSRHHLAGRVTIGIHVIDDDHPHRIGHRELQQLSLAGILHFAINEHNLGFLRSCSRVIKDLPCDCFVVLLNNDTEVLPGWLLGLYETFLHEPHAGLVGSKLIEPDGSLQEAGGVVWRDGSAWKYGNRQDPMAPQYGYLRSVDYISGASIMVPKARWNAAGGFDERYCPAYYEDTDLALSIRDAGFDVLFQPASQVLHHEGVSCGKSNDSGHKRFQAINRWKFAAKWRQRLTTHQPTGMGLATAIHRGCQGHALVIESQLLDPQKDAGSLFMMNYCLALRSLGYTITFLATHATDCTPGLSHNMGARGLEVVAWEGPGCLESLLSDPDRCFALILVARPGNSRLMPLLRSLAPTARIIYFTHDLHHIRIARTAARAASEAERQAGRIKARKLKKLEKRAFQQADTVIHISEEEQAIADQLVPHRSIVIPPAVAVETEPPLASRSNSVVFIANFSHAPNSSGLRWFLAQVWPLVRRTHPEAQLHVVGRNPPEFVAALHGHNIHCHGFVPALSSVTRSASVGVAPLLEGAGVKGKILTCLAHGLPVVSTAIGLEGIVGGDEHWAAIREANTAEAMAAEIMALFSLQPDDQRRISEQAQAFVRTRFGSSRLLASMKTLLALQDLPFHEAAEDVCLDAPRSTDRHLQAHSHLCHHLHALGATLAAPAFMPAEHAATDADLQPPAWPE